jgi:hypothetical protein
VIPGVSEAMPAAIATDDVDLARLLVKSIEGDLRSVHVEPGYDRHWGLP